MYVRDIPKLKDAPVISVKPTDTIGGLCRCLRENRIGATIVSTNGRTIEGVISERDVAYGLALHGTKLDGMAVSALMTKSVITCGPTDRIAIVASTMLSRNIRHIPVVSEGIAIGMVSIRDVLNFRVVDLQQETAHLRQAVIETNVMPQDRE